MVYFILLAVFLLIALVVFARRMVVGFRRMEEEKEDTTNALYNVEKDYRDLKDTYNELLWNYEWLKNKYNMIRKRYRRDYEEKNEYISNLEGELKKFKRKRWPDGKFIKG